MAGTDRVAGMPVDTLPHMSCENHGGGQPEGNGDEPGVEGQGQEAESGGDDGPQCKSDPHCVGVGFSSGCRDPFAACRGQERPVPDHECPGKNGSGDEDEGCRLRWKFPNQYREGSDPDRDGEDQRERAIGADPAVLHDGERLVAIASTAQAICRVRKAVLMQGAGQHDLEGNCDQCGEHGFYRQG